MKILWFSFILFLSFNLNAATEYKRLIIFGDSLSDTGTYIEKAGPAGGGKFTTNPGKLWIEIIADKLHLPLQENRHEGFGLPLKIIGGFNYSQGGARIKEANASSSEKGYTARPLTTQLQYFLIRNKKFSSDDLVFIVGGANDVLASLNGVVSGKIQPEIALANLTQAAADVVNMVAAMEKLGAANIVIINLPAIENTPRALGLPAEAKAFIKQMGQTFNDELVKSKTKGLTYNLIDFYSFDLNFSVNYKTFGFKNVTASACKLDALVLHSSLVCNSQTLVESNADQTYKFADSSHPTTGFSKIAGDFIWQELQKISSIK